VARPKTVLDVFVASPGDTQEERARVKSVIDELNAGPGRNGALHLELIAWESHARPGIGRPQEVVFDTTTRNPDVLIGIFRERFGTPTGVAGSGTEEEIENAIELRTAEGGRSEVMLYFKAGPYDVPTPDAVEQLGRVMAFRQRVQQGALVWEYRDTDDFERAVRNHLFAVLQNFDGGAQETASPSLSPTGSWADELERIMDALGEADDVDTLTCDAIRYISAAANRFDLQLNFGELASYCDRLLMRVGSSRRVEVLVLQGDLERLAGRWQAAYRSFLAAADTARAIRSPADEARVIRHLGRLSWEHGFLSRELVASCRRLLQELPQHNLEERAVVSVLLAERLAYEKGSQAERHELARTALARVDDFADPAVRADILLPARQALYDEEPTEVLQEYAKRVEEIGHRLHDVRLMSEGLGAQIVDDLRRRNIRETRRTLWEHRQLCDQTPGRPQQFRQRTVEALLALAEGRFDEAAEGARDAVDILSSGIVGEEDNAAAKDVVAALVGWRLYETGDEALEELIRERARRLGVGVQGTENVWQLAIALALIDIGDVKDGASAFQEVVDDTDRFQRVEQGLFRLAVLALGAEVVWALTLARGIDGDLRELAQTIAAKLAEHGDNGVLIGFPAIFLGDKRRFLGLALICAGNVEEGRRCLQAAAQFSGNAGLRALEARCLCDAAQAAARLAGPSRDVAADLREAAERAGRLGMRRLERRARRPAPI
jgi:hypothetical protein